MRNGVCIVGAAIVAWLVLASCCSITNDLAGAQQPADHSNFTATTKRAWIPQRGFFAHFTDRQAMKKGHPQKSFKPIGFKAPALPIDWAKDIAFPMYGNDQYGDCMYAAACHGDNTFAGNHGPSSVFDVRLIISNYLRLSGGDNGLNEGDLIPEWKRGLAGQAAANIVDALDLDVTNPATVQVAIQNFGGVLFMFDVPSRWINNSGPGAIWDVPVQRNNNGHGVWWNGVNEKGHYRLQTWGTYVWITPAGVNDCDPSGFVVFSTRWFNATGYAPNGKHITELAVMWQQSGGNPIPAAIVSQFPPPGPIRPPVPIPPGPPVPPSPLPTGVSITVSGTMPAGTYEVFPSGTRAKIVELQQLIK